MSKQTFWKELVNAVIIYGEQLKNEH